MMNLLEMSLLPMILSLFEQLMHHESQIKISLIEIHQRG